MDMRYQKIFFRRNIRKFITYKTKIIIYKYTSQLLKDFIYESNNSKDIFFIKDKNVKQSVR